MIQDDSLQVESILETLQQDAPEPQAEEEDSTGDIVFSGGHLEKSPMPNPLVPSSAEKVITATQINAQGKRVDSNFGFKITIQSLINQSAKLITEIEQTK